MLVIDAIRITCNRRSHQPRGVNQMVDFDSNLYTLVVRPKFGGFAKLYLDQKRKVTQISHHL